MGPFNLEGLPERPQRCLELGPTDRCHSSTQTSPE
jgi:hypothetical protein